MTSYKRTTNHSSKSIETPEDRVTTKQVPKKQNRRHKSRQTPNKHYQEDKYKESMPQANGRFHKNPQEHTSWKDRCSKCGDASHMEGFRCPASRFQCKHCHKFGHFSKLCYNKNESGYKKTTRKPRAHQLMIGRASAVWASQMPTLVPVKNHSVCKCKSGLHKQRPKCKHQSI